jgi:hypothetical protein
MYSVFLVSFSLVCLGCQFDVMRLDTTLASEDSDWIDGFLDWDLLLPYPHVHALHSRQHKNKTR